MAAENQATSATQDRQSEIQRLTLKRESVQRRIINHKNIIENHHILLSEAHWEIRLIDNQLKTLKGEKPDKLPEGL